jgi:hypothetical protein
VLGVDEPCQRAEVGAQCVECVSEVVAESFLAVSAAEEVVAEGVEGFVAMDAWRGWEGYGEAEFALQEYLEHLVVEAVVLKASVV